MPEDVGEGVAFPISTPDGVELEVVCPKGLAAGDTFQCLYYSSADDLINSVGSDWHARTNAGVSSGGGLVCFKICDSCGLGSKSRDCFKCDSRIPSGQEHSAIACRGCFGGSKSKECPKCGEYFGGGKKYDAILCVTCGSGSDAKSCCAKCNKYVGSTFQII